MTLMPTIRMNATRTTAAHGFFAMSFCADLANDDHQHNAQDQYQTDCFNSAHEKEPSQNKVCRSHNDSVSQISIPRRPAPQPLGDTS